MGEKTRTSAAVFALKPEWADPIPSGAKTVEIRRGHMNRMIGRTLVYRTGTGLIVAETRVKGMHATPPDVIWAHTGRRPASRNPCSTDTRRVRTGWNLPSAMRGRRPFPRSG